MERGLDPLHDRERRTVADRLEAEERAEHVLRVVQRLDPRLVATALAVEVRGVFGLDLRGVAEHHGGERPRGRRAEDRPGEAAADEVRQVTAVVDVRVAQDHRVDVFGAEREVAVAADALGAPPLEQPAVEQHRLAVDVELVHRPGDRAGGAAKGDGRRRVGGGALGHRRGVILVGGLYPL